MRPGGSHAKGFGHERQMARELSLWWYGEEGYLWRRSGNEARKYEKDAHTGDIVPTGSNPDPKGWIFHCELKFWKRGAFKLFNLIVDPDTCPVPKIWAKLMNDKKARPDLIPLLIIKENRQKDMICFFRLNDLDQVRQGNSAVHYDYCEQVRMVTVDGEVIVGIPWQVFKRGCR